MNCKWISCVTLSTAIILLLGACAADTESVEPGIEEPVTVTAQEGELVELDPKAVDPDDDTITYHYSAPFNDNGTWNTSQGDAGEYNVTILASDGSVNITQQVTVRVQGDNAPPVLRCQNLTVSEGERFRIPCNTSDPDGDEVVMLYDGLDDNAWYSSGYEDNGTYTVNVTAMDKHYTVEDQITVTITATNRPPQLSAEDVQGAPGEAISANASATDPDGDDVTVTYGAPFKEGLWTPSATDTGTHTVAVTASDGEKTVTDHFTATVGTENEPPELQLRDVRVAEGETVRLPINATDPDGDELHVVLDGWLETQTYTTSYDDGYPEGCGTKGCTAVYTVNVTVSDGMTSTTGKIQVYVEDVNRPPVFERPV